MLLKEMLADEREEGLREGRSEGLQEGRFNGLAESILVLLSTLGEIPDDLKARVQAEKDVAILNCWIIAAKKASSVQEFADQIM